MPVPTAPAPSRPLVVRSDQWRLTAHCRETATRRGVTLEQVLAVVEKPEITYTQDDHGHGRQMRQRGRLAVVVAPETRTVITVLLRAPHQWTDEEARAASPANSGCLRARGGRGVQKLSPG